MRNHINIVPQELTLPRGIQRSRPLPDPQLGALWDSIVIQDLLKTQLLSAGCVEFYPARQSGPQRFSTAWRHFTGGATRHRQDVARTRSCSSHGGVVPRRQLPLLEVEPHALTSSGDGKNATRGLGPFLAGHRGGRYQRAHDRPARRGRDAGRRSVEDEP